MRPDKLSERHLIQRISGGDRDAEVELFERYQLLGRVQEMVYCRTQLPLEDQRDIIAEALLAITVNLRAGKYNPDKAPLGSYVWGVARNKIRDSIRKRTRKFSEVELNEQVLEMNEKRPTQGDDLQTIHRGISQLDQKYQSIIVLRYLESRTIREIAEIVAITETQVRNRLAYGLRLLKNYIKDQDNFQQIDQKDRIGK